MKPPYFFMCRQVDRVEHDRRVEIGEKTISAMYVMV